MSAVDINTVLDYYRYESSKIRIGDGNKGITVDGDNVGIGTTSPGAPLEITGTAICNNTLRIGSTSTSPTLSAGSGDALRITNDHGYIDIGSMNDGAEHIYASAPTLFFGTGGSPRATLISTAFYPYADDDVDLGTTSNNWKRVLTANGTAALPAYTFGSDSNTGIFRKSNGVLGISCNGIEHSFQTNGLHLASGDWFRAYGNAGIFFATYGGGLKMTGNTYIETHGSKSLDVKGNIKLNAMATFSGGGYATARRQDSTGILKELISSERFKTDITDLSLEESLKVLDCRPILFRDKEEQAENPSSEMYAGISAESLQTAGYEWVLKYDIDEDGNKTNIPRGIHYEFLVVPLINIIKNLKARIEALEGS